MGCDIHTRFEYRRGPGEKWINYDCVGDFFSGRNYELFAILGDVRGVFPYKDSVSVHGRGLPDDVSDEVRKDFEEYGHSPSHCYRGELLRIFEIVRHDKEVSDITAMTIGSLCCLLQSLEFIDEEDEFIFNETRLVFFFDS